MSSRKRIIRITIAILAAFAVFIVLLPAVESKAEGSTIHTVGDAIWYAFITLTTVGYGDLYPVTAAGKIMGAALALCSLGVLTALIGLFISFINGQAGPLMRLRSAAGRKWYAFNDENKQSEDFAESVLADDPDAVINHKVIVNGITALRRVHLVADIVISCHVQHRTFCHGHQKT